MASDDISYRLADSSAWNSLDRADFIMYHLHVIVNWEFRHFEEIAVLRNLRIVASIYLENKILKVFIQKINNNYRHLFKK